MLRFAFKGVISLISADHHINLSKTTTDKIESPLCLTNKTKSPSQIPERAIKVIRDYVAALRFPFLRGPSSKLKQSA